MLHFTGFTDKFKLWTKSHLCTQQQSITSDITAIKVVIFKLLFIIEPYFKC